MQKQQRINKWVVAAMLAGASTAAPMAAHAEISANLSVASQYLWRGQSLTSGGALSGGIDYAHDSGLYAGFWTSSEDEKNEYDLYGGYAGSAGSLHYDIGYTTYWYTEFGGDLNFQEAHLALGYGAFGVSGHFGVGDYGWGDGAEKNRDNYYTVSYEYQRFGALLGYYDLDDNDLRYTHLDLSYEVYDGLVFTVSQVIDRADDDHPDAVSDNLQFVVSYTFTF